ncbi:hypothetical protein Hanom_Chr05g00393061 [Helianthus anomalus]
MEEEFYYEFDDAFTSTTTSTPKSASNVISKSLNFDNVYGIHQKPPKLMNIKDSNRW